MLALLLTLTLTWPVPAPVTAEFDPPAQPWLAGHRGLDLPAEPGTPVRTPRTGVVLFAAQVAGRDVVVIGHGWLRATYEPVTSHLVPGTSVAAGAVIGVSSTGSSHCSEQCVHWGLKAGQNYLDPRLLLSTRAILKPHRTHEGARAKQ